MLSEFAFTPSIFDEKAQDNCEDWLQQLLVLGSNMFPQTAAWPVMVSNLYGGSWESTALSFVNAIQNQKARNICQGFLKNVAKTLVHRPIMRDDEWPAEQAIAWGREALDSHDKEPIDRIVACRPASEALAAEAKPIRCINEAVNGGFWKDVGSPWTPEMEISTQVNSIRKLCVHAEFLCLVTPHIYGGNGDETDFALAFIKSSFNRPDKYVSPEIEIHTEAPDKPGSALYPGNLKNKTHNIASSIRSILAPGQKVRLVLWPKLLDRYVLTAVYSEMSDGSKARSPRWGVSMSHIAKKRDDNPPSPWSLLNRNQLVNEFERYCKMGITGFAHAVDVVKE